MRNKSFIFEAALLVLSSSLCLSCGVDNAFSQGDLLSKGSSSSIATASPWEGRWRYVEHKQVVGDLKIENCSHEKCFFRMSTIHGMHTCDAEGEITLNGNTASYLSVFYLDEEDDKNILKISMVLNEEVGVINISANDNAQRYLCGMRGVFTGKYENARTPVYYETGFDCKKASKTVTETTICTTEKLAKANMEIFRNYPSVKTKKWFLKRDNCGGDEECLWQFYTNSLKEAYEKETNGPFDLYGYFSSKRESVVYPTDLVLMDDYLRRSMGKEDYEAFTVSLSDVSLKECEGCFFALYGVPGLYTIDESVFLMDEEGIWLAFVSSCQKWEGKVAVYTQKDKKYILPQGIKEWVERQKKFHTEGVVFKNFR